MASRAFILTGSPYTKAQIALASFVPNIKQPHQDAERPYQVEASDYEVQPDNAFDFIIRHSSESHLKVLVTRLLSLGVGRDKENKFQVMADKGYIYSLNNPNKLFKKIVFGDEAGEDTQRWLEDCKQSRLVPRFVVGYRTFIDGRLAVGRERGVGIEAEATVPVGAALGDVTGLTDIGASVGYTAMSQASAVATYPGERIYAICYRKVELAYRKDRIVASLAKDDNVWEAFAAPPRGDKTEANDLYVEADLQEKDDDGGSEGEGGSEAFSVRAGGECEVFTVLLGNAQGDQGGDEP